MRCDRHAEKRVSYGNSKRICRWFATSTSGALPRLKKGGSKIENVRLNVNRLSAVPRTTDCDSLKICATVYDHTPYKTPDSISCNAFRTDQSRAGVLVVVLSGSYLVS
jgi:hypothetical protein